MGKVSQAEAKRVITLIITVIVVFAIISEAGTDTSEEGDETLESTQLFTEFAP